MQLNSESKDVSFCGMQSDIKMSKQKTHALFNSLESRLTLQSYSTKTWVMLEVRFAERTCHKSLMKRRVNKRQMQTQESKIDTGKALDADLVDTESIRTDSTVQDDNSRSGNDTDADDADIRPIYNKEPMAVVQLTAGCNIFAIGQQHTEQPEIINEGRVDHTADGSKPKPRSNNQTSRSLPVSKSTRVTIMAVPKADHSKSSSSFSDSKQFEVNSRAKVPSNKTTNRNKPVEQIRIAKKPERQIPTGHRTVGLRWVPTGKTFTFSTTKVDSEPPNGSNARYQLPQILKCATLDVRQVNSVNSPKPTLSSRPTKVDVPKELPKVSMVNTSLKKLKYHLAGFDVVVKERTTPTTITEGSWGFEHTKACFRDEIIPSVKKTLKYLI
ncbi:hypothetical protein Tco_0802542 [Tanacetum coccineum]|uniref:Uncharacterized protein n=1 Tax=Tanacetum coccineum TaxID=301880 RepID=A0ABQ4ZZ38_9ASTR